MAKKNNNGGANDTIRVSSKDQATAKKKLQNKFNGKLPKNAVLTYNKTTKEYIYTVPPTPAKVNQKRGGGYMERMAKYQAGGLGTTPMYGSNTIPGTPETSQITYKEADAARLKQLEQELEEAQESTKYMDEAQAEIAAQESKIASLEQSIGTGVKSLDKIGAFDKLKEKGAEKTEALSKLGEDAATNLARVGATKADDVSKILADQLIPEGSKVIDVAKDKLNMGLGSDYMGGFGSDQSAKMAELFKQSNPQEVILRQGTEEALKQTSTNVASGLTPAQYGNIGAVASLAGEGIKMASDDQDATTMNVGESVGSGLSGVGTGIGAATTTAMLMGAPLGPVGMAAGVIGGAAYGLGKGLIQRGKARKEEGRAEAKKERDTNIAKTKQRLEGLKSREYSGFDFGSDIRQGGGIRRFNNGGVGENMAKKAGQKTGEFLLKKAPGFVGKYGKFGAAVSAPAMLYDFYNRGQEVSGGSATPNMTEEEKTTPNAFFGGKSLEETQSSLPKFKGFSFEDGGIKLPGGTMKPIPGSDAVEFKGQSHDEGGIMLDPMTEVEGKETMDKVTMKNGGKNDYFFSQHLKLGGKSFAQRHKDILKNGGSQADIDALAKLQEDKAGRDPNAVSLGAGGYKMYDNGGPKEERDFAFMTQSPYIMRTYDQSFDIDNYVPTAEPTREEIAHQAMLDKGFVFNALTGTYTKPSEESEEKADKKTNTKTNTKKKSTEERTPDENFEFNYIDPKSVQVPSMYGPPPSVLPYADGTYPEGSDEIQKDLTLEEKNLLDKANSDRPLTDAEEKALKNLYQSVPTEALIAAGAQMIPAIYALSRKDAPAEQMASPGSLKAPALDRVNFNTERSMNAASSRAISRAIETSGMGPAGIIAKMSTYRRKQEGDLKIAAQEARMNTAIANQEAAMAQQANARNIANAMQVDQVNTQLREAERIAQINRKQEAIDVLGQGVAGTMGDVLSFKANERLAMATGDMGIYERDRLRTFLKGQINPDTGKPYTNSDIAAIFNKRFKDPVATKEDKDDTDDKKG